MYDIDSEFKAYFLGFVQTDGYLSRKYVGFSLNAKDRHILEEFEKHFGGKVSDRVRNTNFKNDSQLSEWRLNSVEFVKDLNALGIPCGKKARRIKPIKMSAALERHYIRGLVDGDGSLSVNAAGVPYLGFTTDSIVMKRYFRKFLQRFDIDLNPDRNSRDSIYNFCIARTSAQPIATYLYDRSTVYLKRKKAIADKFRSWTSPIRGKKINWTKAEIAILVRSDFDAKNVIQQNLLSNRSNEAISLKCSSLKRQVKDHQAILSDWE